MSGGWDHSELASLHTLARAEGILLSYWDYQGTERFASPEALIQVLRGLGHSITDPSDADQALDEHNRRLQLLALEPVLVAWDGHCPAFTLAVSRHQARGSIKATLIPEDETHSSFSLDMRCERQGERGNGLIELTCFIEKEIPFGRHTLRLECNDQEFSPCLISAPKQPQGHHGEDERRLGVFLPLYALQSDRSLGIGDLGDLTTLAMWACERGCSFISTLPLLAAYLDEPFEPSPYVPVSRLFFNELFIDVKAAVRLIGTCSTTIKSGSESLYVEARRLSKLNLVDYRAVWKLKQPLLKSITKAVFSDDDLRGEIDAFVQGNPEIDEYARFRAAVTKQHGDWHTWPASMSEGVLNDSDFDEIDRRYHIVVQWLLDLQMATFKDQLDQYGASLYLDLPVGVHGGGFDVWRDRELFMTGLDVGAPPDPLFTKGQNWATPPIHPGTARLRGHAYWQSVLRTHFRHARMLRIDHAMALHRLFCIPQGMTATEGVYLQYPAEELMAILCLEAHRAEAIVVGENLGTVPPETNDALREHGLFGMWIGQFEFRSDNGQAIPIPPSGTLATLNTHDMPTFAGFWKGRDLDLNQELGLSDHDSNSAGQHERQLLVKAIDDYLTHQGDLEDGTTSLEARRDAVLQHIATGDAELMQINLEDLWLETEPQNVPGIATGYPSWRRRAALDLESILSNHHFGELLEQLARLRMDHTTPLPTTRTNVS